MTSGIYEFKEAARKCTECRGGGLLYHDEQHGWAYPLFDESLVCPSRIIVIGEAPNWDDTFDESKRRLTYDIETDPTGNFTRELLSSVGIIVSDVLFTNSVLCLPAHNGKKYKVLAEQSRRCRKWLDMVVSCCNARIIITLGGDALNAIKRLSSHKLKLKYDAGKIHSWNNRYLLPLYHPSKLGQVTRPAKQQLADIQALKAVL